LETAAREGAGLGGNSSLLERAVAWPRPTSRVEADHALHVGWLKTAPKRQRTARSGPYNQMIV